MGFVFYLFAQSAGHLVGARPCRAALGRAAVLDLRARFDACCTGLGMTEVPEAYLLNGNGMFNAFAMRFLGRHYIVLLSSVVDAMAAEPDGIEFLHRPRALGHVRMAKHLTGQLLRAPVLWLPLLGAGYSRAKETTCDRHGRACCETPETAARALVVLAAGAERWKQVDLGAYASQADPLERLLDVVPRAGGRLSMAHQAGCAGPRSGRANAAAQRLRLPVRAADAVCGAGRRRRGRPAGGRRHHRHRGCGRDPGLQRLRGARQADRRLPRLRTGQDRSGRVLRHAQERAGVARASRPADDAGQRRTPDARRRHHGPDGRDGQGRPDLHAGGPRPTAPSPGSARPARASSGRRRRRAATPTPRG